MAGAKVGEGPVQPVRVQIDQQDRRTLRRKGPRRRGADGTRATGDRNNASGKGRRPPPAKL